ncbi:MAG: hypothetical protein ACOC1P_03975 [Minisyncoccales bacterium]
MLNNIKYNKIPEEYKYNKNKEVRVILNNNTERIGIFERYDNINIYLRPCLVSEPLVDKKGETIRKARIENERPVSIRRDLVGIIDPLSEGYIESFANSLNSSSENSS